ncbi:unnamed protein product [Aspergillus oryzae]|uniref:Unnamed protein product n=2 Tax=Aspergillus oryzae TaxID=5062 RepID=A0AAN4YUZ6_ASPOZ|nr:unnamed protein product [Aspergillus oryzae]GMF96999.1 unnamed protein product [Aspergillus oryzae]GMG33719.1 unnamed protein product [Aspergillus oryzae]GMG53043.1 unnamed protein product [Aspergillus oryzae var. brunneus]
MPTIDRAASKLFRNADEAVADLESGSTILSSGFGLCGVADTFLQDGQIPVRLDESGRVLEHGEPRETRIFNGKTYLMENALTGDVAILRAWKRSSYTTKAFSPLVAKAATLTIVEAENIVPVGSIDPNDVDLPGIFVDRIVPATAPKSIEIKKLRSADDASNLQPTKDAAMAQRNRIAKRAAKELRQGYYVNLGVGLCGPVFYGVSAAHS